MTSETTSQRRRIDTNPPQGVKVHEYEVRILEANLDTFGHVNNAVYLSLFEEARWDIVTSRGYGIDTVQKNQVGPTILEITIRFRREILNREVLKIRTWVMGEIGKVTTLRQVMVNDRGEAACVADFVIALFDMKARRLIEPSPEWKAALDLS
jgi:acyl-CoA thioester hydrolase